jgi:hypothetical protein
MDDHHLRFFFHMEYWLRLWDEVGTYLVRKNYIEFLR